MHVLLIFFLFTSIANAGEFEEEVLHRWKSIIEVRPDSKLKQQSPLKDPVGTSIEVMEVILNGKNFRPLKDCVLYQIPKGEVLGVLYIHQTQLSEPCSQFHLNLKTLKKENIFNFAFELEADALRLFFDELVLKISIPKHDLMEVSTISAESDFKFKNKDYCYQVNDKCEVVQKYNCQYCPKSYLNVVESNCRTDYSKICADFSCGGVEQPACIRGWNATKYNLDFCLPDSPVGFCRPGLRVFCLQDRLICK